MVERTVALEETDINGGLHRTVLPHGRTTITFQTGNLTGEEVSEIQRMLTKAYSDADARRLSVKYYDVESANYKTGTFYIEPPEYIIDTVGDDVYYEPVEFTFREY